MHITPGSDINATYLPNCLLILKANRSISGLKHRYSNTDSKTLTGTYIQFQHDLIKIPCQKLCLASQDHELLKDDFF